MKVAFIPSTFLPYVGGAETQTTISRIVWRKKCQS